MSCHRQDGTYPKELRTSTPLLFEDEPRQSEGSKKKKEALEARVKLSRLPVELVSMSRRRDGTAAPSHTREGSSGATGSLNPTTIVLAPSGERVRTASTTAAGSARRPTREREMGPSGEGKGVGEPSARATESPEGKRKRGDKHARREESERDGKRGRKQRVNGREYGRKGGRKGPRGSAPPPGTETTPEGPRETSAYVFKGYPKASMKEEEKDTLASKVAGEGVSRKADFKVSKHGLKNGGWIITAAKGVFVALMDDLIAGGGG